MSESQPQPESEPQGEQTPPPPPPPPPADPYAAQQAAYAQQEAAYAQQDAYAQAGYGAYPPANLDPYAKSKMVAGLRGIFLGVLGIHRFYLGFNQIGVIMIIVTVLTCGLGAIWGLVEGILYLVGSSGYTTEATGRPLRD
mgnify:FL=1